MTLEFWLSPELQKLSQKKNVDSCPQGGEACTWPPPWRPLAQLASGFQMIKLNAASGFVMIKLLMLDFGYLQDGKKKSKKKKITIAVPRVGRPAPDLPRGDRWPGWPADFR